jgi:hypothetical protein
LKINYIWGYGNSKSLIVFCRTQQIWRRTKPHVILLRDANSLTRSSLSNASTSWQNSGDHCDCLSMSSYANFPVYWNLGLCCLLLRGLSCGPSLLCIPLPLVWLHCSGCRRHLKG